MKLISVKLHKMHSEHRKKAHPKNTIKNSKKNEDLKCTRTSDMSHVEIRKFYDIFHYCHRIQTHPHLNVFQSFYVYKKRRNMLVASYKNSHLQKFHLHFQSEWCICWCEYCSDFTELKFQYHKQKMIHNLIIVWNFVMPLRPSNGKSITKSLWFKMF